MVLTVPCFLGTAPWLGTAPNLIGFLVEASFFSDVFFVVLSFFLLVVLGFAMILFLCIKNISRLFNAEALQPA